MIVRGQDAALTVAPVAQLAWSRGRHAYTKLFTTGVVVLARIQRCHIIIIINIIIIIPHGGLSPVRIKFPDFQIQQVTIQTETQKLN